MQRQHNSRTKSAVDQGRLETAKSNHAVALRRHQRRLRIAPRSGRAAALLAWHVDSVVLSRALVLGLALCTFGFRPSELFAEPSSQAVAQVMAHDQNAREAFQQRDFQRALAELRAAQDLAPASPRLYNMAQCLDELGHNDQAAELYTEYAAAPDARPDRRAIAMERIEALSVAPEPHPLPEHRDDPGQEQAPPEPTGLSRGPFFSMVGLAGATVFAVAVVGAVALNYHNDFEQLTQADRRAAELHDKGRRLTIATDVLLGMAAAAATAALVLAFFTDFRPREGTSRSTVSLAFSGTSLALWGRF